MLVTSAMVGSKGMGTSSPGVSGASMRQDNTRGSALHALEISEIVDQRMIGLIEKIPYHAWGGALNMSRPSLLAAIPSANYSTLVAVCQKFLNLPDSYWNDNRDRDFSLIMESIEKQLGVLGYSIDEREIRHYMCNNGMKRIQIPSKISKK